MVVYLKANTDKRSAGRDIGIARHLREAFGGLELNAINGQRVRDYIQMRKELDVMPGTINRELALLSTMLNYARVELEWDNVSNAVTGRKLPVPEGRVRWLSRDEAARLIVTARTFARPLSGGFHHFGTAYRDAPGRDSGSGMEPDRRVRWLDLFGGIGHKIGQAPLSPDQCHGKNCLAVAFTLASRVLPGRHVGLCASRRHPHCRREK